MSAAPVGVSAFAAWATRAPRLPSPERAVTTLRPRAVPELLDRARVGSEAEQVPRACGPDESPRLGALALGKNGNEGVRLADQHRRVGRTAAGRVSARLAARVGSTEQDNARPPLPHARARTHFSHDSDSSRRETAVPAWKNTGCPAIWRDDMRVAAEALSNGRAEWYARARAASEARPAGREEERGRRQCAVPDARAGGASSGAALHARAARRRTGSNCHVAKVPLRSPARRPVRRWQPCGACWRCCWRC